MSDDSTTNAVNIESFQLKLLQQMCHLNMEKHDSSIELLIDDAISDPSSLEEHLDEALKHLIGMREKRNASFFALQEEMLTLDEGIRNQLQLQAEKDADQSFSKWILDQGVTPVLPPEEGEIDILC